MFMSRSGKEKPNAPSEKTGQVVDDIPTQWELYKSHLSSLSNASRTSLTSSTSEIIAAQIKNSSENQFWQSALIPIETKNGETIPTALNFSIKAHSASGAEVLNTRWENKFVSRDVAPHFHLGKKQDEQLIQSFMAGLEITSSICKNAGWPSLFDEAKIDSATNLLETRIRAKYEGNPRAQGLFDFAKKQIPLVYSKEQVLPDVLKTISDGVGSLMDGFQIVGYASNDAVPDKDLYSLYSSPGKKKSSEDITSDRMLAQQRILIRNISLAEENSEASGKYLGLPSSASIYYNSTYWDSIYGIAILARQMRLHAQTAKDAFSNEDGAGAQYPGKGTKIADENFNSKLSALRQAAVVYGVGLGQSLDTAIAELDKICALTEGILQNIGINLKQLEASDYSAELDKAFARKMDSNPELKKSILEAQLLLGEFTVKYAVARQFGTNHEDGSANSSTRGLEAWVNGVSDDSNWLPLKSVPGLIAMNYAMDYVGRGSDFLPPSQLPILDMQYLVDKENSVPVMGKDAGFDDPNTGYARILWVVRINEATSLVRENEGQFKEQLAKMAKSANPGTDMYVQEGVQVKHFPGHTDYVVEIRDPFSVKTEKEANSFSSKIYVPRSIYDPSAGSLLLYEMGSQMQSSAPRIIEEKDRDPYFGLFARVGLTANPDFRTTDQKAFSTLGTNLGKDAKLGEAEILNRRNISAAAIKDLYYGIFGLKRYDDAITDRRLTYLKDRAPSQYDAMSWDLIGTILRDNFGDNLGSGFNRRSFDSCISGSMDTFIKEYLTENLANEIASDPVLKGTPGDFLDSYEKINAWSPIDAELLKWTIRLGALLRAKQALGGNAPSWLEDEITTSESKMISAPINYILPDSRSANAFWSYSCNSLVELSRAFRHQGMTLGMQFGDTGMLQLTASPSLLGTGGIFNPSFKPQGMGATAQFDNVNAYGINAVLDLYKKESSSAFPLGAIRLIADYYDILPTGRQYYSYNASINQQLSQIGAEFAKPASARDAPPGKIYSAAVSLKQLFGHYNDAYASGICNEIMHFCNPADPANYDIATGGRAWAAYNALYSHVSQDPKYKGGVATDSSFSFMDYATAKNTYSSKDPLTFASQMAGMVRAEFEFEQKIPGFLDISGVFTVYPIPPALAAAVASATISGGHAKEVFRKTMADLPQFSQNWMIPANLEVYLKHNFALSANSIITAGANFQGSVSAFKANEIGGFANYVASDIFVRNLDIKAGISGSFARAGPVGTLNPNYGADLQATYAFPGLPGASIGGDFNWGTTILPSGNKFYTAGFHMGLQIPIGGFKTYKGEPKDIPQTEYPRNDFNYRKIRDLTPEMQIPPLQPQTQPSNGQQPQLIIKRPKERQGQNSEEEGQGQTAQPDNTQSQTGSQTKQQTQTTHSGAKEQTGKTKAKPENKQEQAAQPGTEQNANPPQVAPAPQDSKKKKTTKKSKKKEPTILKEPIILEDENKK
ncbi:MAG: hypothetical protein V1822_03440 [Candidatus Micrarchaeota archaeon]